MIAAALIISIVALIASALCALAVMELITTRSGGVPVAEGSLVEEFEVSSDVAGTAASSHGLPDRLDRLDRHLVLVVSPVCVRCAEIVASLGGVVPGELTVVVTAAAPARMRTWCIELGLPPDEVVFDDHMAIVGSLQVASSPTVVGLGGGKVVFAAGIGGPAALERLLEESSRELFEGDLTDAVGEGSTREQGDSST